MIVGACQERGGYWAGSLEEGDGSGGSLLIGLQLRPHEVAALSKLSLTREQPAWLYGAKAEHTKSFSCKDNLKIERQSALTGLCSEGWRGVSHLE